MYEEIVMPSKLVALARWLQFGQRQLSESNEINRLKNGDCEELQIATSMMISPSDLGALINTQRIRKQTITFLHGLL